MRWMVCWNKWKYEDLNVSFTALLTGTLNEKVSCASVAVMRHEEKSLIFGEAA
jgi:hypothetical protein